MYYAVKNGNNVLIGIYTEWKTCEAEVSGARGVMYKKFKTKEEAIDFLLDDEKDSDSIKEIAPKIVEDENTVLAYVDGSFKHGMASYGFVLVKNDTSVKEDYGITTVGLDMRNVAGEIMASMKAVDTAYREGYKKIIIYHDYEGIEKFATRQWNAKNKDTIEYSSYMNQMRGFIEIDFVKVKGHSGNRWNEYADRLAGAALL